VDDFLDVPDETAKFIPGIKLAKQADPNHRRAPHSNFASGRCGEHKSQFRVPDSLITEFMLPLRSAIMLHESGSPIHFASTSRKR
jgi:hypothetical protein